jgi:hypothetical protein
MPCKLFILYLSCVNRKAFFKFYECEIFPAEMVEIEKEWSHNQGDSNVILFKKMATARRSAVYVA